MTLRKFGDTPNFSEHSRCNTCRHAHITKDQGGCVVVKCLYGSYGRTSGSVVDGIIIDCNRFDDESVPHLIDMKEVAWLITPSTETKHAGFVPSKKVEVLTPAQVKEKNGGRL